MTIRKKILLFSALALGAFLAAVYVVSRFALLNSFARLESESGRENVARIKSGLQIEETQLGTVARDYAQWDRTYEFMQSRDPGYVREELTNDTFKIVRVGFFALFDPAGNLVLYRDPTNWQPDSSDLETIAGPLKDGAAKDRSLRGVLDLKGRIMLVDYEAVLTSRGQGESRGTLVMGRELDQSTLASLSRSVGFPVWLEAADPRTLASSRGAAWSDGVDSARFESDSTMLEYVVVRDISGKLRRFVVGRTPRTLYLEGKTQSRYLWGLLMLAGVVYCGALFFFVEEVFITRIAGVSSEVSKVTVSGDLSLRLNPSGNDEITTLARTVNSMLAAIQKAKAELMQAQESLRFHAEHDALTGVLNRRAIRDVLRKELSRCRREKNTLGVILADVDHFKKVNDHYGHASGDAVLVTVVQRISATLRSYDAVGRYGGEEFLIIAPGCDLALAQKLAERIRSSISDEAIDLGNDTANVTVSLGVILGTAESDPEFLVAQADTAMYHAKRNGRNRIEIGSETPAEESVQVQ
ncbi:MAG TPA: diguanylate cyclase [Terriglobales bacterium]